MNKIRENIKKVFVVILIGIVCVGTSGCNNEKVLPVADVDIVTVGNVQKTLRVDGEVKSADYNKMVMTDLVACPVQDIYIEQGQSVKEGQVICLLDVSKVKLKTGQSPEVVAMRDGVIAEVFAVEGLCASDGKIASIIDDDNLCVEIWFDEVDMPAVEEKMKAKITAKELDNIIAGGQLRMLSQINEENGFKAIVDLASCGKFKLGMDVTVCFEIAQWENVFRINSDYIIQTNGEQYVLVAKKEEKGIYNVKKCDIQVLGIGDNCVAVTGDSLLEGDYIITEVDMYTFGDKVEIQLDDRVEE